MNTEQTSKNIFTHDLHNQKNPDIFVVYITHKRMTNINHK